MRVLGNIGISSVVGCVKLTPSAITPMPFMLFTPAEAMRLAHDITMMARIVAKEMEESVAKSIPAHLVDDSFDDLLG